MDKVIPSRKPRRLTPEVVSEILRLHMMCVHAQEGRCPLLISVKRAVLFSRTNFGNEFARPAEMLVKFPKYYSKNMLRCSPSGAGMSPVAENPVIVPDRELDEEKKPGESEPPRIRCPLCGWSPRKEDKWFCECAYEWNTFDTGGVCLPSSVD